MIGAEAQHSISRLVDLSRQQTKLGCGCGYEQQGQRVGVGWVEGSETHRGAAVGLAPLDPPYTTPRNPNRETAMKRREFLHQAGGMVLAGVMTANQTRAADKPAPKRIKIGQIGVGHAHASK